MTENELQQYLASVGMVIAMCNKLVAKNGLTFITAVFKISCSIEYKDLFYNEFNWPVGCELRGWYAKLSIMVLRSVLILINNGC